MANLHTDDQDLQGIKLFGKTISLQGKQSKGDQKKGHHQEVQTAVLKRPEKIIPCPRCKSMEPKFCYFNNYNVNQPRHFCKGCQRYWTAGGALRNVPVGAGRRKVKPTNCLQGFPENYLYDASGVEKFGTLDQGLVVEEWKLTEGQGSFRHLYPVKRRRNTSGCS